MRTENICTCVCHVDQSKRHCDELSCMPCCTLCKECSSNIPMGKMRLHMLESHGIEVPPASPEKIEELKNLLSQLKDLYTN
jgi:hypothetical protein